MGLTDKEIKAISLCSDLMNICQQICGNGSSRDGDLRELCGSIHSIQNAIMSQAAARAYPDKYRLMGCDHNV